MSDFALNPSLTLSDHRPAFAAHVDWYSAMLYNYSVGAVLDMLGYDYSTLYAILSDPKIVRSHSIFTSGIYNTLQGYHFHFQGLTLTVSEQDYVSSLASFCELSSVSDVDPDTLGIFDVIFSKMRLELSGTAIDLLRIQHKDFDFDRSLFDADFWSAPCYCFDSLVQRSSKITRIDCAFDFVNYASGFFDNYLEYCNKLVSVYGSKMPVQSEKIMCYTAFSVKVGNAERTIYSGSNDRILRVYDKKMQVFDNDSHVIVSRLPSFLDDFRDDLHSWFRVELQCRNKVAASVLSLFDYVGDSWRYVLDYCCPLQSPLQQDDNGRYVKAWFFPELLNAEKIEAIRLKDHLVSYDIATRNDFDHVVSSLLQRAKPGIKGLYKSGIAGVLNIFDKYLSIYDDPEKLKYLVSDLGEFASLESILPFRFDEVFLRDRCGFRLDYVKLFYEFARYMVVNYGLTVKIE